MDLTKCEYHTHRGHVRDGHHDRRDHHGHHGHHDHHDRRDHHGHHGHRALRACLHRDGHHGHHGRRDHHGHHGHSRNFKTKRSLFFINSTTLVSLPMLLRGLSKKVSRSSLTNNIKSALLIASTCDGFKT